MKKPSDNIRDYADFELMFPGRYIKGVEVKAAGRPIALTIVRIEPRHELSGKKGESESKPALFFKETEKGLVLNKTNAVSIAGVLTRDPRKWIGHKIVLCTERGKYGGVMRDVVRIDEDATKTANNPPTGRLAPVQPPPSLEPDQADPFPQQDEDELARLAAIAEQDRQ
jgi:hypothetical protein